VTACGPPTTGCRSPKSGKARTLESLVAEYCKRYPRGSDLETKLFRDMPSDELAIRHAASARDEDGRCFDHQRRVVQPARRKAEVILMATIGRLRCCTTFHALHTLLSELLLPVPGLGALYVYDTALRLGAYLRLSPKYIYLHAGTRVGAKALGLACHLPYLQKENVPSALRALTADEIESFLCIFAGELARISPTNNDLARASIS
jgi:hypothetical protein